MNEEQEMRPEEYLINEEFPQQDLLNESFESDEKKSPDEVKQKIENFWGQDPIIQKKYVRNFSSICQFLGNDCLTLIVERMYSSNKKILESHSEITLALMDNIELVFKVMSMNPLFVNNPKKKYAFEKLVVNFLSPLLDSSIKVLLLRSRQMIVKVCEFLSSDCCNNELLSTILSLLHDPLNESSNIGALELLEKMISYFSKDYIKGFIAMDILALLQNQSPVIRIEACSAMFSMLQVFDKQIIEERFLEVIESLTRDSNTSVVNHLIKFFPKLAKNITFNKFESLFFPKFLDYLNSKNRFQKEESLTVLGQLIIKLIDSEDETHIYSVYSSIYFERILDAYFDLPKLITKMNLPVKRNLIKANYSVLNKVIQIKKKDIWQRTKKLILLTEEFEPVIIEAAKLEISQQLDSIAKICDKVTIEKDLIFIIDKYYLNTNPNTSQIVKQNTIKILSEVLKELSIEKREKYADVYQATLNMEIHKWRLRYVISEQMEVLSQLFMPETVFSKIIPMYFAFCRDNCAVVRKSASRKFFSIFKNILDDENSKHTMLINMKSFGGYNRFVLRQSFVLMAESLLMHFPQEFDKEMEEMLVNLGQDKVANVRVSVARLLANLINNKKDFPFLTKIKDVLLQKVDSDVFNLLKGFLKEESEKLLQEEFEKARRQTYQVFLIETHRINELKISKGIKPKDSDVDVAKKILLEEHTNRFADKTYKEMIDNLFFSGEKEAETEKNKEPAVFEEQQNQFNQHILKLIEANNSMNDSNSNSNEKPQDSKVENTQVVENYSNDLIKKESEVNKDESEEIGNRLPENKEDFVHVAQGENNSQAVPFQEKEEEAEKKHSEPKMTDNLLEVKEEGSDSSNENKPIDQS
jgi:hypothetical protein